MDLRKLKDLTKEDFENMRKNGSDEQVKALLKGIMKVIKFIVIFNLVFVGIIILMAVVFVKYPVLFDIVEEKTNNLPISSSNNSNSTSNTIAFSKKIEWKDLVLSEYLPKMEECEGTILINDSHYLKLDLVNKTLADYKDYKESIINSGYKEIKNDIDNLDSGKYYFNITTKDNLQIELEYDSLNETMLLIVYNENV